MDMETNRMMEKIATFIKNNVKPTFYIKYFTLFFGEGTKMTCS